MVTFGGVKSATPTSGASGKQAVFPVMVTTPSEIEISVCVYSDYLHVTSLQYLNQVMSIEPFWHAPIVYRVWWFKSCGPANVRRVTALVPQYLSVTL